MKKILSIMIFILCFFPICSHAAWYDTEFAELKAKNFINEVHFQNPDTPILREEICDILISLYKYQNPDSVIEQNPNSFCCICHDDKHPSASVFKADGGTWLYSCRSTSCPFKIGNIIQVVQEKNNLSRHKAIEKICSDLGIIYKENEEYRNLLMDNIHVINDDIKYSHQDLYSVSYRYLQTLRYLHYAALDTLQYADANGFLFSISTGHLAEQLCRSDRKTTTEDISYFAMLDLIRKIDINNQGNF